MHGYNPLKGSIFSSLPRSATQGVFGLRHLFHPIGQPLDPSDRFKGAGSFPTTAAAIPAAAPPAGGARMASALMPSLGSALRKLEARIQRGHNELWTDRLASDPGGPVPAFNWENPSIPAGYTYLLQFIAHDTVASAAACVASQGARAVLENMRRRPLALDTLYGGGPDVDVAAFEFGTEHRDSRGRVPRTHLRVGPWRRPVDAPTTSDCPFRDLARAKADPGEDDGLSPPHVRNWLTEVMVADRRNDAHALISQLTVLFHLLHNEVMRRLEQRPIGIVGCSVPERAYRRFLCARLAVTLIYRNIIEKDVLTLVLHPQVHARYASPDATLLDPTPGIPLEFTHGAFRFGHAMVRETYKVNSEIALPMERALLQSSTRSPGFLPVTDQWLVDWSRFFATGTLDPNLSRRIGPDYAPPLRSTALLGDRDPDDHTALPARDLMGASFAGLWSVPKLYAKLQNLVAGQAIAPLLPPFEAWQTLLRQWLTKPLSSDITDTFEPDEVEAIVADPPMPFFVMFEAAHSVASGAPALGGGGRYLGPFGSIITAEAMFGALRLSPLGLEGSGTVAQQIAKACGELLGDGDALADVPEIASMPALLAFMGDNGAFSGPE